MTTERKYSEILPEKLNEELKFLYDKLPPYLGIGSNIVVDESLGEEDIDLVAKVNPDLVANWQNPTIPIDALELADKIGIDPESAKEKMKQIFGRSIIRSAHIDRRIGSELTALYLERFNQLMSSSQLIPSLQQYLSSDFYGKLVMGRDTNEKDEVFNKIELGKGGGIFSERAKRISRRLIYYLEDIQEEYGEARYGQGMESHSSLLKRAENEFFERYNDEP